MKTITVYAVARSREEAETRMAENPGAYHSFDREVAEVSAAKRTKRTGQLWQAFPVTLTIEAREAEG